ncbi:hypothetical protein ACXZ7E_19025 [Paenibacillus lautus]
MKAGLIDECHLLLNPIVLGGGNRALADSSACGSSAR